MIQALILTAVGIAALPLGLLVFVCWIGAYCDAAADGWRE